MEGCIFCNVANGPKGAFITENQHFVAVADLYPVSKGHTLIISRRHYDNIFQLPGEQAASLLSILAEVKGILDGWHRPTGYNIASNIGADGGQTVFHLHVHVIPRYPSDTLKPEAGGSHDK